MAKLIFNNFLGLAPAGSTRTNLKIAEEYHIASSYACDLVSNPGTMTVGKAPGTSLKGSATIASKITKFYHYMDTSTNTAFSIDAAKIHAQASADGALDNATSYPNYPLTVVAEGATHNGATPHTSFSAEDLVVYPIGSTNYGFVSYNDNTDGDIARFSIDGSSTDYDFVSGTAAGGAVLGKYPHTFSVAENGFLYISDANSMHKFDGQTGANGTFNASVIDLPVGWVIRDHIDHSGLNWIFATEDFNYKSGTLPLRRAGVFLWNYISRNAADFSGLEKGGTFYINDIVNTGPIFVHEGIPHLFCQVVGVRTQLRRFNGSEFEVIWEEPGSILPNKGGVSSYLRNILWINSSDVGIYSFGKSGKGFPETFNAIGTTVSGAGGALSVGSSGNYWLSYGTSIATLTGINKSNQNVITVVKELPRFSKLNGIWVFYKAHSDSTANSQMTISLATNFSTSNTIVMTLTHSSDRSRGYAYKPLGGKNFSNVHAVRLQLDWALNSSATATFEPYRIELDYEPSDNRKK